jgi:hypothetical protein
LRRRQRRRDGAPLPPRALRARLAASHACIDSGAIRQGDISAQPVQPSTEALHDAWRCAVQHPGHAVHLQLACGCRLSAGMLIPYRKRWCRLKSGQLVAAPLTARWSTVQRVRRVQKSLELAGKLGVAAAAVGWRLAQARAPQQAASCFQQAMGDTKCRVNSRLHVSRLFVQGGRICLRELAVKKVLARRGTSIALEPPRCPRSAKCCWVEVIVHVGTRSGQHVLHCPHWRAPLPAAAAAAVGIMISAPILAVL